VRKTRRTFIKSAGVMGALAAADGLKVASASTEGSGERGTTTCQGDMQCVVTGRNKAGKSVIVSHGPVKPVSVALFPGSEFYRIWGSDEKATLPSDGTPPAQPNFFPPTNGFRFGMFTLPPATSAKAQPPTQAQLQEMEQKLPGLLQALEADHPGMHTTDSVDFDIVVCGEVVLELDDGAEVVLHAGDCVIQNGTRHAWHNRSSEKAVIAFSLVGAEPKRTG